jgi:hypothetical protein
MVVLHKMLMLLLSSTVHNLSSSDIIMLRVHRCSNHRVNTVLIAQNSVLLLNDEVLHIAVRGLRDSNLHGLLGLHLHKGVV